MKLLIAGSRNLLPRIKFLDTLVWEQCGLEPTEIISGGAKGVDSQAKEYAEALCLPFKVFEADWDKYGKSAGYRRNKIMATYADELLAIWDGESKGTSHMIDIMHELGKPVHIVILQSLCT